MFNYEPDFPKDVREVLESVDENQEKIKSIIGKSVKVKNFTDFEQKCEEVLGVEINPILDYFVKKYSMSRDKFALSFEEFIDLIQKWADDSMVRKFHDNDEDEVQLENMDEEKEQLQAQSRDHIVLKFDRHSDKIYEIFENYAEPIVKTKPKTPQDKQKQLKSEAKDDSKRKTEFKEEKSDAKPEAGLKSKELFGTASSKDDTVIDVPHVKLRKLDRILDDLAYLTGTSIVTFPEYSEGTIIKKSSADAKEQLSHYIWKRLHDDELLELRKTKKSTSIYKPSKKDIPVQKEETKGKNVKKLDSKKLAKEEQSAKVVELESDRSGKVKKDNKNEDKKEDVKEDKKKVKKEDKLTDKKGNISINLIKYRD